jgi:hypothetical protein
MYRSSERLRHSIVLRLVTVRLEGQPRSLPVPLRTPVGNDCNWISGYGYPPLAAVRSAVPFPVEQHTAAGCYLSLRQYAR